MIVNLLLYAIIAVATLTLGFMLVSTMTTLMDDAQSGRTTTEPLNAWAYGIAIASIVLAMVARLFLRRRTRRSGGFGRRWQ